MADINFEDLQPFVEGQGDNGKTAREKINRNFQKLKGFDDAVREIATIKENIIDINGKRTFAFNFGKSATGVGYVSRFVEYQLVQGHTYRLSMETESAFTTYLSFRDDNGNTIEGQTNIGKVIGRYTVDFECIADSTRLYLTIVEQLQQSTENKLFEVNVIDLSDSSLQGLEARIDSIEKGITLFGLGSNTTVNVKLPNLMTGRTYALSFDNVSDVTFLKLSAWYDGNENVLHHYPANYIDPPLFFSVPSNADSVVLYVRATANVEVKCSLIDVTLSINASRWAKVPMFELGQFYRDGNTDKDTYSPSNQIARTKRGYTMHLVKGDVIGLSSYDGYKFQVVRYMPNDESEFSQWNTSDYTIVTDGEYIVKITTSDAQTTYSSSDTLANLFRIKSAGGSSGNDVQKVLDIVSHNEERDIAFAKTGYYVNNLGEVISSPNWYTSQPIRLYAGETIEINCSSTTASGAPVIVKVNVGTDAFPSQDQEASYEPLVFSSNVISEHKYHAEEDCHVILQYWKIAGSPSIYSDSNRLAAIETRLSNVENGVVNFPEDYILEKDRIYRELMDRAKEQATFIAFNTDQHFSKGEIGNSEEPIHVLRGIESLADIARIFPVDLIVLGGDVAGYRPPSQTVKGILEDINILNEPFSDINTKCISLSGNHDAYQNNRDVTAYAMYNLHFKRSKWIPCIEHEGTDNLSAFLDDTDSKIRYVFLDTFTQNGRSGVRDYDGSNQWYVNQDIRVLVWSFLKNALNTMGEGYKAIIFSHNPLTNEFNGIAPYKENQNGTDRRSAFEGNLDLSTSVGGDTTTINDYADKIIACICGHEHVDAYAIGGSGILYITTTTAAPHTVRVGIDDAGTIPNIRTMNTVTETAFDFFVVNTFEETIEALRFGQGSNRKWKYGSNARLIEYRNCISGKVSIPSLTLTFTESEDGQPISGGDVISVQCDADGRFEAYLKLASEYDITCDGYTLDTTSVEVEENVDLGSINVFN